jgi:hypothetical protein
MLDSICPYCQNTRFELSGEAIIGAPSKLPVMRCTACAAPVAVLPPDRERVPAEDAPVDARIRDLGVLVSDLHRRLGDIEGLMRRLLDRQTVA